MSSYNRIPTSPRSPRNGGQYSYYTESSTMKNAYYGQCDSGISDVFYSSPMEVERDGSLSHNHRRPKLMVQGSLEDVENGDSGIMMGEDETFKDSARSHSNPRTESFVPMDIDSSGSTRARSNSPKSMSDGETSKLVGNQESRVSSNKSRRAPRLPKRTVPSSISTSVGSEPSVSPRISGRSSSANALLSSTTKFDLSSTATTTTTTAPRARHQQPSSLPTPPTSTTTNGLTCNMYSLNTAAISAGNNQRVHPMASDFSVSIQHLRQYMNLFIPDKDGDT